MHVHLNWAMSLDGRLAAPDGSPLLLSDAEDLARVHALRARRDAILVGVGTVLADDPGLRAKHGPDPLRVVLDAHGRTPEDARVLDGGAPTLVLHGDVHRKWGEAEHEEVPVDAAGRLDLFACLEVLERRGMASVLVEGGGRVLRSFLEAGLHDEVTCFVAPVFIGGEAPSVWPGAAGPAPPLRVASCEGRATGALLRLENA